MGKEEACQSREESSGSFQKMHGKCCLELFFVVTVLLTIQTEYFSLNLVFTLLLVYSKHLKSRFIQVIFDQLSTL